MEKDGLKSARAILERGIKVINYRFENERVNLWTTYLNLEYNFGTEKTLITVFEKAISANKPKVIYFKLIDLYQKDQKFEVLQ